MEENLFDGSHIPDRVVATARRRRRVIETTTDAIVPILGLYVWAFSYGASLVG